MDRADDIHPGEKAKEAYFIFHFTLFLANSHNGTPLLSPTLFKQFNSDSSLSPRSCLVITASRVYPSHPRSSLVRPSYPFVANSTLAKSCNACSLWCGKTPVTLSSACWEIRAPMSLLRAYDFNISCLITLFTFRSLLR